MSTNGHHDLLADAHDVGDGAAPAGGAHFPERRRRLSWTRLFLAFVLVVGGVAAAAWYLTERPESVAAYPETDTWSAPYADVTNVPAVAFENPGDAVANVVLAFVVADEADPCAPAWGGVYGVDEAADVLDLDRRIVRLRQVGKEPIISFGGQRNDELSAACTDPEDLAAAYLEIVEHYDVTTIDLDIEGEGLADQDAHARRAAALAEVQQQRRADGDDLVVWLTLPVTPSGMTADGVSVIDATLAGGVDLAGVNLMTMNFGVGPDTPMLDVTTTALEASAQQLVGAWRRAGLDITPGEAWARLGVTPMLGRNDLVDEVFTLADAEGLVELVDARGVGRLSYWSLNRDQPCGPNYAPLAEASDFCTHLDQDAGAFALAFASLSGDPTSDEPAASTVTVLDDDPERSPYPIWQPDEPFLAGDKVVWHGYVYEAKWWTEGDDPEAPVVNVWDTPWRILGPVLEEDLVDPVRVPRGAAPAWDGDEVYEEGDLVWLDGAVYEAKWWNEGFQPNREVADDYQTPWRELDPEPFLDED
ncbi:MAG: glycosyl hydrolase family 18 protein [Actinomycetota bacterium]|nr:glycosyl hydrolase family 18 protein [Actinomycetota bacterium]